MRLILTLLAVSVAGLVAWVALSPPPAGDPPAPVQPTPQQPVVLPLESPRRPPDPEPRPASRSVASAPAPATGRLVVEVVDSRGVPRPEIDVELLSDSLPHYAMRLRTGATGRVRTPPPPDGLRWDAVCVSIAGGDDVTVRVPQPVERGDAPIRLRLPPVGTLRLDVFREDNARWGHPLELHLDDRRVHRFVGGRVTLELAYANRRVHFHERSSRLAEVVTESVAGPPEDRVATRRVEVAYAGRHLRGRALDPSGRVITTGELRFQSVFDRGGVAVRGATRGFAARDDGRFLVVMERRIRYRAMRVRWFDRGRVRAEAEIPGLAYELHRDVGDLRLSATRLLAAGRIGSEEEVREAFGREPRVWVELHPADGERDTTGEERASEEEIGFFSRPASLEPGTRFGRYAVDVGHDGRFAIYGQHAAPFTLCVRGAFGSSDRRGVLPGTQGVVLPVTYFRYLEGKVLVSPGVFPRDLIVDVRAGPRVVRSEPVGREGDFEVGDVQPGAVSLEVRVRGTSEPVFTGAAEATVIDLRGRVPTAMIRVVDPDGRPIEGADIDSVGEDRIYRKTDADGRAAVPIAPVRLRVSAIGFRPTELAKPVSTRVTLRRGIPVRLRIDYGVSPPPDADGFVMLRSVPDDPYARVIHRAAAFVEGSLTVADVEAPAPGVYRVSAEFEEDGYGSSWDGSTESATVTIADRPPGARQEIRVRLSPPK